MSPHPLCSYVSSFARAHDLIEKEWSEKRVKGSTKLKWFDQTCENALGSVVEHPDCFGWKNKVQTQTTQAQGVTLLATADVV